LQDKPPESTKGHGSGPFCVSAVFDVPLHGTLDQLGTATQVELGADVLAVRVDRVHTHAEVMRDLTRAFATADELEYL